MVLDIKKKLGSKRSVDRRLDAVMSSADKEFAGSNIDLKRSLSDASPRVRAAAIDVVRKRDSKELEGSVRELLSDKNRAVRYAAVECLGVFHEGECLRASWLYPLLSDSNHLVRIETLESLGKIGDRHALPLIAGLLTDGDSLVRSYAARFLADLQGKQYVSALKKAMTSEQDDVARVGLAYALFKLGETKQLTVLLVLLSSDDYRIRCASANSLGALEFDMSERRLVLSALATASRNALAVADRSTVKRARADIMSPHK